MGGPPVRGEMLAYWEPDGPVDDDRRAQWIRNAERIATGLVELAHLPAFVDPRSYRVGFFCDGDIELAGAYVESIMVERIEARQVSPPVPESANGSAARPADEVVLPCRPEADDEEIIHAVLATMKASHALEFQIVVDAEELRGVAPEQR